MKLLLSLVILCLAASRGKAEAIFGEDAAFEPENLDLKNMELDSLDDGNDPSVDDSREDKEWDSLENVMDHSGFCNGRPDGLYPNYRKCTQFFHCSNNITFLKDCPANLVFNERTNRCDWRRNVPRCQGGTTRRPFTTGTTRRHFTTQRPSSFCNNRPDGVYPNYQSCTQFFHCSNKRTFLKDCPANLVFNERTNRCDWRRNVPRCQGGTTRRPFTTQRPTSLPCFCYNGGSPFCHRGRLLHCRCFGGHFGRQCQFGGTTRRPFTSRPTTGQGRLQCFRYACDNLDSCKIRIRRCPSGSVCVNGHYRPRSGRFTRVGDCLNPAFCSRLCDLLRRRGGSDCEMRCCRGNLCNRGLILPSTPRPVTRRPSSHLLQALLKILEAFKKMIEAVIILLRGHLEGRFARFHKREMVGMMTKVNDQAAQLGESRDPEILQAKRDVMETGMRAQKVITKLDELISNDAQSTDDENDELQR